MRKIFEALETNKTWTIVEFPKGKKSTGCKSVYKIKHKANESMERYN